ncbi:hypothetical protein LCGC14_2418940, partial [marine sediment metagenome]
VGIDGVLEVNSMTYMDGGAEINGTLTLENDETIVNSFNGIITFTMTTADFVGSVNVTTDLDVNGTSNLDIVDVDGASDFGANVTMSGNAILYGPRLKWTYVATNTVLTQADSGSWWGTFGASSGMTFTLPTDGSNMAGVYFCIYNSEGITITIDPVQGASIIRRLTNHSGSNERIQSTAEHDSICLMAGNNDIQWYPFPVYGTWADIN